MSAEKARHVDDELMEALLELPKEELAAQIVRLQAQVSGLQESQVQGIIQESSLEDGSERMQQRIALGGEQQQQRPQRVSQEENSAARDVEHGEEEEQEEMEVVVEYITDLPSVLLGHVLQYLKFMETRVFFACGNSALWNRRVEHDARMTTDLILPARPPYALFCNNFINVCSLDLGPWCSNAVLAYMCDERVLPSLEHLAMARSIDVTDEGLALLSTNPSRRHNLKSLDVRFCRRISYGQTLDMREGFETLDLVRRQPPWMDGFLMANSVDGGIYKRYESWADGTFIIWNEDGSMCSCGYFCDYYEDGSENFVVSRKQLAFDLREQYWQSLPEWEFCAYRVGNRRLQMPDGNILEARPLQGLYPANSFPRAEHANSLSLGHAKYFDRQGDECNRDHPEAHTAVEKLRMQPLNMLMPPPQVVELCRTQVSNMRRVLAERAQEHERQVHLSYGGNDDELPPAWFVPV